MRLIRCAALSGSSILMACRRHLLQCMRSLRQWLSGLLEALRLLHELLEACPGVRRGSSGRGSLRQLWSGCREAAERLRQDLLHRAEARARPQRSGRGLRLVLQRAGVGGRERSC
jgi:hypothetical protein